MGVMGRGEGVVEQMVQGQVVQAEVVGHESDGVPYAG